MNPYEAEKIIPQYQADLRALAGRSGHARQAPYAGQDQHPRQAQYAGQARRASAGGGRRHMLRRRAGWALVALGLRLAYVAGED